MERNFSRREEVMIVKREIGIENDLETVKEEVNHVIVKNGIETEAVNDAETDMMIERDMTGEI